LLLRTNTLYICVNIKDVELKQFYDVGIRFATMQDRFTTHGRQRQQQQQQQQQQQHLQLFYYALHKRVRLTKAAIAQVKLIYNCLTHTQMST
jgi:hypothetical protein